MMNRRIQKKLAKRKGIFHYKRYTNIIKCERKFYYYTRNRIPYQWQRTLFDAMWKACINKNMHKTYVVPHRGGGWYLL